MKKNLLGPVMLLFATITLFACTKITEDVTAAGGNLPTHYIVIEANGSFTPALLRVASGSSITFVNNDKKPHNIMSNDSISIRTNVIAPNGFFKFKNDTLVGIFPYKCLVDSNIRGTIIITP
jgi:plastocyanin